MKPSDLEFLIIKSKMLQLHILFLLIIFGNIVIPFIINIYHDIFLYMTAYNEAMQFNSMVSFARVD